MVAVAAFRKTGKTGPVPIFSFSAKTVQAGKWLKNPFTMKNRDYLGRVGSQPQRRRPPAQPLNDKELH